MAAVGSSLPGGAAAPTSRQLIEGQLDMRRMAMIARAGPSDHLGDVLQVPDKEFDLDKTIFRTLDSKLARKVQRERIAVSLYWNEEAAKRIQQLYAAVPPAIPHDRGLLDFMAQECDFAVEHADGSFMDHLQFCYEYSLKHMAQYSPRVMLLHSILGVGTNIFPMDVSKIPKLHSFLTDFERVHVEAFPSVLRLLFHGPLMTELEATPAPRLQRDLEGICFHRVIDNQDMYMDVESLWVHLNYHLIHSLDFLPAADWELQRNDGYLRLMVDLHTLLSRCGKLIAKVDLSLRPLVQVDAASQGMSSGQGITLGQLLVRYAPALQRRLFRKAIGNFSARIGHDLNYELKWKDVAQSRL